MITFTGQIINKTTIQARGKNGKLHPSPVALYKLDPQSVHDNMILEHLVDLWGQEDDTFVRTIEDNFKYNKHNSTINTTEQFFVLTNKPPKNSILKAENVLAVAQTSSLDTKKGIELDFLQIIPKSLKSKTKEINPLKGIGSKMLEELKSLFYGRNLWLYSNNKSVNFYTKNGFKQIGVSKAGLPILKF